MSRMWPLLVSLLVACQAAPALEDAGTRVGDAATPDAQTPEDAGAVLAADAGTDAGPAALCPPSGPFGRRIGDVAPDITLRDCDGVERSLHELCETEVVWLFEYADWCPPCRSFASTDANPIYDRFRGEAASFEGWMIISEDAAFNGPDAADCAEIRDRYGIHMPVLFDEDGALQRELGVASNEIHVVLGEGARIEWIGHYAGDEIESRIEAALAP